MMAAICLISPVLCGITSPVHVHYFQPGEGGLLLVGLLSALVGLLITLDRVQGRLWIERPPR